MFAIEPMKSTVVSLLLVLFGVLSAAAQTWTSTINAIPAKSVAAVHVDWTKVRSDVDLRRAVKGDDFVSIARNLGIDEGKISEFSIFADVTPTTANKIGVIMAGRFLTRDLVQSAQRKNWKTEQVGKRTAYVNPLDDTLVLALRDGLAVTGTRTGVKRAAETVDAPATGLAKKKAFKAIFSQLGGNVPLRFFLGVPQEYQLGSKIGLMGLKLFLHIGFFTPLGMVMNAMGMIQSVGLSMAPRGGDVPVHMVAQVGGSMIGPAAAKVFSGGLNLLKSAAKRSPSADQQALSSMTFSSSGGYLSIRMIMPKNALLPA